MKKQLKQDLRIGDKYNRWTVLSFDRFDKFNHKHYLCQCDCGTVKTVSAYILHNGESKSCGCLRQEVLHNLAKIKQFRTGPKIKYDIKIGQKYGRWLVINEDLSSLFRAYLCQCDCGTIKSVDAKSLGKGESKSCGCLKIDLIKLNNKPKNGKSAGFNKAIYQYKNAAKDRNLDWNLSEEQCEVLFQTNCYYCGTAPSNIKKYRGKIYYHSGLDRVNNSKGYFIENIVPCCWTCNWSKLHRTQEEFLNWIKQIYENLMVNNGK